MTGAPTAATNLSPARRFVDPGAAARDWLRPAPRSGAAARHAIHDERGQAVPLGQFFGAKPVVLAFVYYSCPMLCTQVLNAMTSTLGVLSLDAGKDFEVVLVSFDPRETAGAGRRQESGTAAAIQTSRRRCGLAFPDRRRAGDQASRRARPDSAMSGTSRRNSSRIRPASSSSRPTAGRPGISSASSTVRAMCGSRCSKPRREDRLGRRFAAAVLLSLRPDDRPLRSLRHADAADRRRGHGPAHRHFHRRDGPPREVLGTNVASPSPKRLKPKPKPYVVRTPLFPEQASTMAARVDALYFFLVGLTVFFSLLIAGLIVAYTVNTGGGRRTASARVIHGGLVLEITWSVIPFLITMGIFVWGASVFCGDVAAARRDAQRLRRRQAVDVEVPAPRRAARDQRAARAGRAGGEVDHDLRGCDPRRVCAGVPREGRRHSRAATHISGSSRRSRAPTTCSARSTAARAIRE